MQIPEEHGLSIDILLDIVKNPVFDVRLPLLWNNKTQTVWCHIIEECLSQSLDIPITSSHDADIIINCIDNAITTCQTVAGLFQHQSGMISPSSPECIHDIPILHTQLFNPLWHDPQFDDPEYFPSIIDCIIDIMISYQHYIKIYDTLYNDNNDNIYNILSFYDYIRRNVYTDTILDNDTPTDVTTSPHAAFDMTVTTTATAVNDDNIKDDINDSNNNNNDNTNQHIDIDRRFIINLPQLSKHNNRHVLTPLSLACSELNVPMIEALFLLGVEPSYSIFQHTKNIDHHDQYDQYITLHEVYHLYAFAQDQYADPCDVLEGIRLSLLVLARYNTYIPLKPLRNPLYDSHNLSSSSPSSSSLSNSNTEYLPTLLHLTTQLYIYFCYYWNNKLTSIDVIPIKLWSFLLSLYPASLNIQCTIQYTTPMHLLLSYPYIDDTILFDILSCIFLDNNTVLLDYNSSDISTNIHNTNIMNKNKNKNQQYDDDSSNDDDDNDDDNNKKKDNDKDTRNTRYYIKNDHDNDNLKIEIEQTQTALFLSSDSPWSNPEALLLTAPITLDLDMYDSNNMTPLTYLDATLKMHNDNLRKDTSTTATGSTTSTALSTNQLDPREGKTPDNLVIAQIVLQYYLYTHPEAEYMNINNDHCDDNNTNNIDDIDDSVNNNDNILNNKTPDTYNHTLTMRVSHALSSYTNLTYNKQQRQQHGIDALSSILHTLDTNNDIKQFKQHINEITPYGTPYDQIVSVKDHMQQQQHRSERQQQQQRGPSSNDNNNTNNDDDTTVIVVSHADHIHNRSVQYTKAHIEIIENHQEEKEEYKTNDNDDINDNDKNNRDNNDDNYNDDDTLGHIKDMNVLSKKENSFNPQQYTNPYTYHHHTDNNNNNNNQHIFSALNELERSNNDHHINNTINSTQSDNNIHNNNMDHVD